MTFTSRVFTLYLSISIFHWKTGTNSCRVNNFFQSMVFIQSKGCSKIWKLVHITVLNIGSWPKATWKPSLNDEWDSIRIALMFFQSQSKHSERMTVENFHHKEICRNSQYSMRGEITNLCSCYQYLEVTSLEMIASIGQPVTGACL